MKNPFLEYTNDELCDVIRDIEISKEDGKRVESFVPYAREIYENLNGATESITLRECIEISRSDFYDALQKRFLELHH
jgi:hypothetical protein